MKQYSTLNVDKYMDKIKKFDYVFKFQNVIDKILNYDLSFEKSFKEEFKKVINFMKMIITINN